MPRWSNPVPLDAYYEAPAKCGVYEIGFFRELFNPKYIGKSEGVGGIRSRLAAHATGNGNSEVAAYLHDAIRNNLYCRWQVVENARRREALMLNRWTYEWNKRLEYTND